MRVGGKTPASAKNVGRLGYPATFAQFSGLNSRPEIAGPPDRRGRLSLRVMLRNSALVLDGDNFSTGEME